MELDRYLEDIESRLDSDIESAINARWDAWCQHKTQEKVLRPGRPSKLEWKKANINDAVADEELMVYSEFWNVNRRISSEGEYALRIRPNYGVGNVATAFGAKCFIMPYETNTLPNVIKMGEDACRKIVESPLPDVRSGNFEMIYRVAERFKEIKKNYPKIGRFVQVEQPDLQGPMDNLELLYGSDVFYALYDEPELVHRCLDKITTYIENELDLWLSIFPDNKGCARYFRHVDNGCICVRDDSAMNLSPEFYDKFVAPYDGRLLKRYGGIVHFCGRGDHYIDHMNKMEGLYGVNMSQPHLNDMEKIFAETIDKGIHLSLSVKPFEVKGHKTENLVFLYGE